MGGAGMIDPMDHLEFIHKKVAKFTGKGLPREDLFQEGVVALMVCIKKYDPANGKPFEAYADVSINHRLWKVVRENAQVLRVPNMTRRLYRIMLESPDHKPGLTKETAKAVGRVLDARKLPVDCMNTSLHETRTETLDRSDIDAALGVLNDYQRDVIIRSFGLYGRQEVTLDQIGRERGVIRQAICHVRRLALKKMRGFLDAEGNEG